MRLTKILAVTLILTCTSLIHAQTPTPEPPPVDIQYPVVATLITPRVAIHADDDPDPPGPALTPIQRAIGSREKIFDNMLSVSLDVVINQNGRVESAHPTAGPARFYAQAQEIQMHRAYAPVRIDGDVVRAHFTDYVALYPTERWADHPVPFPSTPDLRTLSISLERTSCFGSCPPYTVTLKGSGDITFTSPEGSYVAIPGTHHAHISQEAVLDLVAKFRSANFYSALDEYHCNWTDLPVQTLIISINGIQKKVSDYGGSVVGLPDAIEALESAIDKAADTPRWITGNAATIPALQAEHWNFATPSADNLALFNSAITHRNTDLIRIFTTAKAPITAADPHQLSPICAASGTGNPDIVEQLLALHPKIKLAQNVVDDCLSLSARSGNVPVVQFWLSRGARTTFPPPPDSDDESGRTRTISPPLLPAIQSGNPDVVAMLLHAHANVASKFNSKRSLPSFALAYSRSGDDQSLQRTLSLLIEAGANVNEETDQDRPAIFEVSQHPSIIPLLIASGASPNQRDSENKTPLMLNAYVEAAVEGLLTAGADPTLKSTDGTTALSAARQANCTACITLIEAALKAHPDQHP